MFGTFRPKKTKIIIFPYLKYCLIWSRVVLWGLQTFSCSSAKESSEYNDLATKYCSAPTRCISPLLPPELVLPLYVALMFINHITLGNCPVFEHHLSKKIKSKQQRSRPSRTGRARSDSALFWFDVSNWIAAWQQQRGRFWIVSLKSQLRLICQHYIPCVWKKKSLKFQQCHF